MGSTIRIPVAVPTHVNRDESRHVGFGVKFLADAISDDARMKQVVQDTLTETLPTAVLRSRRPGSTNRAASRRRSATTRGSSSTRSRSWGSPPTCASTSSASPAASGS